jgi:diadenosine tetraphosphate (Ap4A) HIT family hydrolase
VSFVLHERLEADTIAVAELELSTVRLMRDANYPWLILIPRHPHVSELIDLSTDDQAVLMTEIAAASWALRSEARCDKLNVATLGNMVPQLHVHVIARTTSDPAWPKPVWGAVAAKAYGTGEAEALAQRLAAALMR